MQPLLLLFCETNCWWKLVLVRYGPNPSCDVLPKHTGFVSNGQYKSCPIAQLIVPYWHITPLKNTKIIWCPHIKKICTIAVQRKQYDVSNGFSSHLNIWVWQKENICCGFLKKSFCCLETFSIQDHFLQEREKYPPYKKPSEIHCFLKYNFQLMNRTREKR